MSESLEPSPILKQQVDINLQNGMDEFSSELNADWTKSLQYAGNVLVNGQSLKTRLGAKQQVNSSSLLPIYRLGASKKGVLAVAGSEFRLFQLDEKATEMDDKGKFPEFSVERIKAGSDAGPTLLTSLAIETLGVIGVARTDRYNCIAYYTRSVSDDPTDVSTAGVRMNLDIIDRNSGNIVRSFIHQDKTGNPYYSMVGVDNRYLHIYLYSYITSTKPNIFIIDTHSMLGSAESSRDISGISLTSLTPAINNAPIMGVVPVSGASVCVTFGDNGESTTTSALIKTTNALSITSGAVDGFNRVTGLGTDGTNFYIVGIGSPTFDPATLALTGWWRDYPASGTPLWPGTASGGISGGGSADLVTATSNPTAGATLNSHPTASFNGTSNLLGADGTLDTYFNNNAGSLWCLCKSTSLPTDVGADASQNSRLFSDGVGTFFTVSVSSVGATIEIFDGARKRKDNSGFTNSAWHLVQVRFNGTNIEVRVDSGSWLTAACGNITNMTNVPRVGSPSAGTHYYNGLIAEMGTIDSRLSDANFDNVKSYINSRYGLAL